MSDNTLQAILDQQWTLVSELQNEMRLTDMRTAVEVLQILQRMLNA